MIALNNWKNVAGIFMMLIVFVGLFITYSVYTGKLQREWGYIGVVLAVCGVSFVVDNQFVRKDDTMQSIRTKEEVKSNRTYDLGRTCFQPVMKFGIKDI
jgi:hypothetical protein